MKKTVTAKFQSIDTAEFAARGLKNNFHRISNIKIRYKNKPSTNNHIALRDEVGSPVNLGGNYLYSNMAMTNVGFAMHSPPQADVYGDAPPKDRPEWAQTVEAQLVLQADPSVLSKITSKLRCLGGYDICVF